MQTLEEQVAALAARVQALENAVGLSRPTTTTEMSEVEFFQLAKIDGLFLQERARVDGRTMEAQAIHEAIHKGAVAGARVLPSSNYEVTQFVS